MLKPEYFRHHVGALLRLSRDVKDTALSERLQDMADEIRAMVSVDDVRVLAVDAGNNSVFSPVRSKPRRVN
jgi:hypothetical protein